MRLTATICAAALLLAACSAPPAGEPASTSASAGASGAVGTVPPAVTGDPLDAVELVDVTSGQTLTLGALAARAPVLLEAMAIWCTNCRAQQDIVRQAHTQADFISVSLDIDPTEVPADLKAYAAQHGYDWHFARAGSALAMALRVRFGTAVLNPSSMPKIVLLPDGTVRALDFNRLYTADELIAALHAG
jgi:thiol-disulfide isomerase/thioredoxin